MLMGRVQASVAQSRAAVPEQRHGPVFALYAIWFLSLPFYRYSVVATYSLDNLLAPLACLAAVFLPRVRDPLVRHQRAWAIGTVLTLYLIYTAAGLLAAIDNAEEFWSRAWQGLRGGFYVLAPLLYIRDRWSWDATKVLIMLCAMAAAVSVFLASIGVIDLEVERYGVSRLEVDWLPKAIGLFSSYGDVAMLYGFTAVVLLSHKKGDLFLGLGRLWARLAVALVLFVGLAGSQSRNMALSTVAAIGAYYMLDRFRRAKGGLRYAMVVYFFIAAMVAGALMVVFGGDVVEDVSGWGGESAYQTAQTRLFTYQKAIELIVVEPVFGVSQATYKVWGGLVDGIHNMWLRILLQRGVIGFLAVIAMVVLAYRYSMRVVRSQNSSMHRDGQLALATLAAIVVAVEFYGGLSDVYRVMLSVVLSSCWMLRGKDRSAPHG